MKFLCQPFPTMSRVHAKFQEFLTTLGFYFIFLNMTSGRKCQITDINIWILEQDYGMGVHFGRGCEIYFLYNLLIHIWGTLLSVVSKLSQKNLFHYSVLLGCYGMLEKIGLQISVNDTYLKHNTSLFQITNKRERVPKVNDRTTLLHLRPKARVWPGLGCWRKLGFCWTKGAETPTFWTFPRLCSKPPAPLLQTPAPLLSHACFYLTRAQHR